MKRILSLALATIMCLVLVLALGSCSFLGKYIPFLNKDEEKETRYTISAEEWEATLNIKNFTIEQSNTFTYVVTADGETKRQDGTSTSLVKCTDSAEYNKTEGTAIGAGEMSDEYYYVLKDGASYRVNDDGSSAYEVDWEADTFGEYLFSLDTIAFEDLTYNEEEKAYYGEINVEGTAMSLTMYFENGVPVKVIGEATIESSYADYSVSIDMRAVMELSNIGTTVIEVPEFDIAE